MFDIGFSEILVIFILALIVLGPEKLPRVVREVGRWVGRARAMARQFQEQLEDEVDVDRNRTSRRPEPVRPVGGAPPADPSPPSPDHTEPVPSTLDAWQTAAAPPPEASAPGGEQPPQPLTPGTHE
jgi:sec-independent protein translocase protein TatB